VASFTHLGRFTPGESACTTICVEDWLGTRGDPTVTRTPTPRSTSSYTDCAATRFETINLRGKYCEEKLWKEVTLTLCVERTFPVSVSVCDAPEHQCYSCCFSERPYSAVNSGPLNSGSIKSDRNSSVGGIRYPLLSPSAPAMWLLIFPQYYCLRTRGMNYSSSKSRWTLRHDFDAQVPIYIYIYIYR
jgi:hypothetical protein